MEAPERPAIDVESHAGDEPGGLGAEECADRAEVGRLAEGARRNAVQESRGLIAGQTGHPIGPVQPRLQVVDGDAVGCQLGGEQCKYLACIDRDLGSAADARVLMVGR